MAGDVNSTQKSFDPLGNYYDYIKSDHWKVRKELFFETHARECAVCGSPYVDLHHVFYDDYGKEQDMDLVPLCRRDHEALHMMVVKTKKDMRADSWRFIRIERQRLLDMSSYPSMQELNEPTVSVSDVLDLLARPIWRLYELFLGSLFRKWPSTHLTRFDPQAAKEA
jgi:hypothetical protein